MTWFTDVADLPLSIVESFIPIFFYLLFVPGIKNFDIDHKAL
jgi:hypothetical protein